MCPRESEPRCKLSVSLAVEAEAETEKGEENLRKLQRRKGEEEWRSVEEVGILNWSFSATPSIIFSVPNLENRTEPNG